jgi:ABC-type molybdate transport system ATPase subunit
VGELATLAIGDRKLYASVPTGSVAVGRSVRLGIRGEQVTICPPETTPSLSPAINRLAGRITSLRKLRPLVTVEIDCGFPLKGYLLAPLARAINIDAGRSVAVEIASDAILVMAD